MSYSEEEARPTELDNIAQFEESKGCLEESARRAYQALCRGVIEESSNKELYRIAINYKSDIQRRLADDGVEMIVNSAFNFIYLKPLTNDAGEPLPNILSTLKLYKFDSFLWIYLRQQFDKSMQLGETCIIKESDIVTHFDLIEAEGNTDAKKHAKKIEGAISKAIQKGILKDTSGRHDKDKRYLVKPLIFIIIDGEQLAAIKSRYQSYYDVMNIKEGQ